MSRTAVLGAIVLLWVVLIVLYIVCRQAADGHFAYVLDDPYIHMAMAKNLARHGVWGITPFEFTSSSSSPLWTLAIGGCFAALGPAAWLPLLLNVALATALLAVAGGLLCRAGMAPARVGMALLAIVFFTPLPALVCTGMEHVGHALLSVVTAWAAAGWLSDSSRTGRARGRRWLLMLLPLLTATRYEGLFLAAVITLGCLVRRRWAEAALFPAAALAPVALCGAISVANGSYWLPNSVLLKGSLLDLQSPLGVLRALGLAAREKLVRQPHMLLLVATLALLWWHRRRGQTESSERGQLLLALALGTTLLHMQFASVGWFYRYEAYLVALALFAVSVVHGPPGSGAAAHPLRARVVAYPVLLTTAFLVGRAGLSLVDTAPAAASIQRQQVQMGRFLDRYYRGESVAANDVGAINYLADLRCLDLTGLACAEVARARLARRYDAATVDRLATAAGVRIALVYDSWFEYGTERGLPERWVKVGEWKLHRRTKNVGADSDTVSFFAVEPSAAAELAAQLTEFGSELPAAVDQRLVR